MNDQTTRLSCACGKVRLEVHSDPIVNAECCCNSCREAGRRLAALPGAQPVLGPHGTTRFVLYRKDRVTFPEGADLLREFRLSPRSRTRRVVAGCCNTPVFVDLAGGHWLSLYGSLWPAGELPPLDLRTMTRDLEDPSVLPDDVPNAKSHSISFFIKLLGAWIAMGFRNPEIPVKGEIHA